MLYTEFLTISIVKSYAKEKYYPRLYSLELIKTRIYSIFCENLASGYVKVDYYLRFRLKSKPKTRKPICPITWNMK